MLWADFPDFADLVRGVLDVVEAVGFAEVDGLHFLAFLSEGVDDGGDAGGSLGGECFILL